MSTAKAGLDPPSRVTCSELLTLFVKVMSVIRYQLESCPLKLVLMRINPAV
jgi:hypothetical protein